MDEPNSGKTPEVLLIPPKDLGIGKDSICVDACIAEIIKHIWAHGIMTLNSCCGHNKLEPSIILEQGCSEEKALKVKALIAEIDNREFKLLSWKLTPLALRQQLADTTQDRIDAERYRYLVDNYLYRSNSDEIESMQMSTVELEYFCYDTEDNLRESLNKSIDAALASKPK